MLDLRPAGHRNRNQCGNNQNCLDMLHGATSRKGHSSLQLHRGGSRRVPLSNIYPLHAPPIETLSHLGRRLRFGRAIALRTEPRQINAAPIARAFNLFQ